MKKIVLILILPLMFSACSRQENIDFNLLIQRIESYDKNKNINIEQSFLDGNEWICFLNDSSKNEFVLTAQEDTEKRIYKISISAENIDSDSFISFSELIFDCYVTDNISIVFEKFLKNNELKKGTEYFETEWYSYSSACFGSHFQLTVQSKKLSCITEKHLTLKPNDKTYLK